MTTKFKCKNAVLTIGGENLEKITEFSITSSPGVTNLMEREVMKGIMKNNSEELVFEATFVIKYLNPVYEFVDNMESKFNRFFKWLRRILK